MIRIERLQKNYPDFALEIERLEIHDGEYFVLLGPSGAGKTVLLLCLAGILQPDRGRIWFDDRDVSDLPPERRAIGWVSQSDTLFPHLTVAGNIHFGRRYCRRIGCQPVPGTGDAQTAMTGCQPVLRGQDAVRLTSASSVEPSSRRSHATTFDRRVARLIEMLDLRRLLQRMPAELSGGEARRVMLARALAVGPRILLLDEPLYGLDPTTQERLCGELSHIHRELGTTTFHITHDHIEARALADRIAVLRDGRIEQAGEADDVFERPATCFVARFTGTENVFALSGSRAIEPQEGVQVLDRSLLPPGVIADDATHVAIRPEHVELRPDAEAPSVVLLDSLRLRGTIVSLAKYGASVRVTVRCEGTTWVALVRPRDLRGSALEVNRTVSITMASDRICGIRKPAITY